jgi:hypothetical protein
VYVPRTKNSAALRLTKYCTQVQRPLPLTVAGPNKQPSNFKTQRSGRGFLSGRLKWVGTWPSLSHEEVFLLL